MKHLSKILIASVIFGFVFSGLLNSTFYIAGRNPYELFLIGLFILLTALSVKANDFTLNIGKIDYCFIIYFISILFFPILFNNYEIVHHGGDLHVLFVSVKIYLIYRIIKEIQLLSNLKHVEKYIFDTIILFSVIAGFIGVLRLLEIPGVTSQIDYIWPSEKFIFRLTSTMSSINGGAAFFSLVSFISYIMYNKTNNNRYLISSIFLYLFVFLSGSLTSISLLLLFCMYLLFKQFNLKVFFYSVVSVVCIIILLMNLFTANETLQILYENRVNRNILNQTGNTIMPSTLETRYMRWEGQIAKGLERPIFGHAVSTKNNGVPDYWVTHNYYIYLFLYTGIIGLFTFLLLASIMLYKVYRYSSSRYMMFIILFILIAQMTQFTINYGGVSELFGVLLYLNKSVLES